MAITLAPLTPRALSPAPARASASMLSTLAFTFDICPPCKNSASLRLTPSPPPAAPPPAAVSSRAFRSVPFKMACCKAEISATVSLPKLSLLEVL